MAAGSVGTVCRGRLRRADKLCKHSEGRTRQQRGGVTSCDLCLTRRLFARRTRSEVNLRGMVTLKCWGSEISSFLLSSSRPTPVGPAGTQRGRKGFQEMIEGIYGSESGGEPSLRLNTVGMGQSTQSAALFYGGCLSAS